ncbi:MAG: lantibiotic immunity ABC transporter MutG family permease subunit [Firmicutes bacterium]|nr:lantibiotic immunity ABC transporter MutG family permease subunit [Bacillota bacterium]
MMRILYVEWLKLRRTPILWLAFLAPVLYGSFMVWYFSGRGAAEQVQVSIYEGFYQVWAAVVVPLGAGLLTGLMSHQEAQAGSIRGLLGSRASRVRLYTGKIMVLVLLTTLSTGLGVGTLVISVKYGLGIPLALRPFIFGGMVVELTTIPLAVFHLWISLALGMGPSIGVGCIGLLLGALSLTSLGDSYWQYLPWGWAARFAMVPGTDYYYGIIPRSQSALAIAAAFLVTTTVGGLIWFERWEGRRVYD